MSKVYYEVKRGVIVAQQTEFSTVRLICNDASLIYHLNRPGLQFIRLAVLRGAILRNDFNSARNKYRYYEGNRCCYPPPPLVLHLRVLFTFKRECVGEFA